MPALPPIRPEDEAVAARTRPHGAFDAPADSLHDGARFDYLLRLGDDALILGQRLSEWCGHAPALEVDLSLANFALDLIGQATHALNEAGACEGEGRDGDALAFRRDVLDFRNCLLVEQPNGDFARTIARQLLYSTWQHMLLQRLTASTDRFLSEFAAKAVKEVAYHRDLASEWTVRLGDGSEESARRMADGLDWCWRFIPELFEVDDVLEGLVERGATPDPRSFEDDYRSALAIVLRDARLDAPKDQRPILGGRRGHHSEHLGHILAPMQYLQRTYPDAVW
ncbi:MAG: phenylacetate-CoA oxygenase subunit PaaC [Sphingomonas sp.]|nr:phenylacetate-CoA oxygenase subunit PaaC [Sphingomonas sp.]